MWNDFSPTLLTLSGLPPPCSIKANKRPDKALMECSVCLWVCVCLWVQGYKVCHLILGLYYSLCLATQTPLLHSPLKTFSFSVSLSLSYSITPWTLSHQLIVPIHKRCKYWGEKCCFLDSYLSIHDVVFHFLLIMCALLLWDSKFWTTCYRLHAAWRNPLKTKLFQQWKKMYHVIVTAPVQVQTRGRCYVPSASLC